MHTNQSHALKIAMVSVLVSALMILSGCTAGIQDTRIDAWNDEAPRFNADIDRGAAGGNISSVDLTYRIGAAAPQSVNSGFSISGPGRFVTYSFTPSGAGAVASADTPIEATWTVDFMAGGSANRSNNLTLSAPDLIISSVRLVDTDGVDLSPSPLPILPNHPEGCDGKQAITVGDTVTVLATLINHGGGRRPVTIETHLFAAVADLANLPPQTHILEEGAATGATHAALAVASWDALEADIPSNTPLLIEVRPLVAAGVPDQATLGRVCADLLAAVSG